MSLLQEIKDRYSDDVFLKADGLDDAIIGYDEQSKRLVYSVLRIVNIYMTRDGMDREDALEYYEVNVAGSASAGTPIFCDDYF